MVLLCRIVQKSIRLHESEIATMSVDARTSLIDGSCSAYYGEEMARRFAPNDARLLDKRFAVLQWRLQEDAAKAQRDYSELYRALKSDVQTLPNLESRRLWTFNYEMPAGFDVEEFVDSWNC